MQPPDTRTNHIGPVFPLTEYRPDVVSTRFFVLGLSFYPLEQAPNMVIYVMSKSGTATSGLI